MTPEQIVEQLNMMLGPDADQARLVNGNTVRLTIGDAGSLVTSVRLLLAQIPESELI